MHAGELKRLLEIARSFAPGHRIVIFGSASLLPKYPHLGEPGQPLSPSLDADFVIYGIDDDLALALIDAVGARSTFSRVAGFHADILRLDIAELFPPGWEERLEPMPGFDGVFFLEVADLAVAKLHAGRPKDVDVLVHLLKEGLLDADVVKARLDATPLREKDIVKLYAVWERVLREVPGGEGLRAET
jgi:hypothetical protein